MGISRLTPAAVFIYAVPRDQLFVLAIIALLLAALALAWVIADENRTRRTTRLLSALRPTAPPVAAGTTPGRSRRRRTDR